MGTRVSQKNAINTALARCTFFHVLGVATILGTIGLFSLQSIRAQAYDEKTHLLADLGVNLATAHSTKPNDPAGTLFFKYWSTAAIHTGTVHGCLLLDPDGKVIAYEPPNLVATHDVPTRFIIDAPTVPRSVEIDRPTTTSSESRLVWSTGQSGSHLCLLISPRDAWADLTGDAKIVIPLTLLLTCAGTGLLYLAQRRLIQRPLNQLLAATAAGAEGKLSPVSRCNDEFGRLATNIDRILRDWHTMRSRVGRMERTLDQRVADQTRRIENLLTKAEREAWIDPLTGLGNRRLLEDRLETLVDEQRATGQDLAIAIFDLDNFKPLNDQKGHAAGDDILRFVGELLRSCLRSTDLGLRYGGDEFVTILLDTSAEDAVRLVTRIMKLFSQRASTLGVTPKVSMSVGVASLNEHQPADGKELLSFADAALYTGKRAGKARVTLFDHQSSCTPRSNT